MAMSHKQAGGGGGGGLSLKTLSNLARELWNYALNRNLTISAIHLPGKLNVLANHRSTIFKHSSEWMLKPSIFRGVVASLGRQDMDLFALRVNHQIDTGVCIMAIRAKCDGN